jgi:parallel beta-helix repeat protein
MRRTLIALTLGALAIGAIGVPASAATTRMVAKDGKASAGNCSGSGKAYKTIQAAVNASSAGDTVLVCSGVYREQVVIGAAKDRLTLRSAVRYGATIKSPAELAESNESTALVRIRPGADKVTIDGFRLKHVAPEPPPDTAGLGGTECGLMFGIQVDGTRAVIRFNTVRAFGEWTLAECGLGYGIGVGYDGEESSATIRSNVVQDHLLMGIVVGGEGSRMTAIRNIVRFYHTNAATTISSADVKRTPFGRTPRLPAGEGGPIFAPFGGVVIFSGAGGTIAENTVESGPGAGPLADNGKPYLIVGVGAFETAASATIRDNRSYRAVAGVAVGTAPFIAGTDAPAASVIDGNLAVQSIYGILVDGSDHTVTDNRANSNVFGIVLDDGSSGATVEGNRAIGNLEYDCVDDSGPDLGSIANTWTDNIGNISDPEGLCVPIFKI